MFEEIPRPDLGSDFEEREGEPKTYYHGSKYGELKEIERRKAVAPEGRPPEEDLDAIYLTPDFAFAFACAARPHGITHIDHGERTIRFEDPKAFDPDREVYIYEVDASDIPEGKVLKRIPQEYGEQIVVDLDRVKPKSVIKVKAGDISKYYKIV